MTRRIGLVAATAVAAVAPLIAATTASADAGFRVSGAYQTQAQCSAAGAAGANLWGPNYFCTYADGWYFLYTH